MRSGTLVLLLCLSIPANAQVVVAPIVDLGDIRGGVTVNARFELVHRGESEGNLELLDLERSCGCVAPVFEKRVLAAGERTTLVIKIRTLGQTEGPRSWPMTLVVRQAGAIQRHRLEARGVIRNEILLEPAQVSLHVVKTITQEIRLTDRRTSPLVVRSWTIDHEGVRVERLDSPMGVFRFQLIAEGSKIPVGRKDCVLTLSTNDPVYERLEVPVTLVRIAKPRVTWSPETPELILAPGQSIASTLVTLRGATIDAVEASDGLTCIWSATESGAAVRVRGPREAFSRVQSALRVRVADETIVIPILLRAD